MNERPADIQSRSKTVTSADCAKVGGVIKKKYKCLCDVKQKNVLNILNPYHRKRSPSPCFKGRLIS